jgi:pimeloyl-ACP methyl ester carboxylesterase
MFSRLVSPLAMSLIAVLPAFSQQPRRGEVTFEPYTLTTYDGRSHPAELGHLWVPENRHRNSDRLIEIAFIRLKSSAPRPGSPIVYLSGGPGIPASGMGRVPVYYGLFEKLRQIADVILLDQRGSGMSSPNLDDCPTDGRFPAGALASRTTTSMRESRSWAEQWIAPPRPHTNVWCKQRANPATLFSRP